MRHNGNEFIVGVRHCIAGDERGVVRSEPPGTSDLEGVPRGVVREMEGGMLRGCEVVGVGAFSWNLTSRISVDVMS